MMDIYNVNGDLTDDGVKDPFCIQEVLYVILQQN